MKQTRKRLITVRVNDDEHDRYDTIARERDKPLGQIIRESLDRMAKRIEREKSQ